MWLCSERVRGTGVDSESFDSDVVANGHYTRRAKRSVQGILGDYPIHYHVPMPSLITAYHQLAVRNVLRTSEYIALA